MADYKFEDDKLSVAVKADGAREIKESYAAFGWRIASERADGRCPGIVHMDFVREHKIAGKDRLQLLQVRFEVAVNFLGKAAHRLYVRAAVIGALIALIGAALIVYGAVVMAYSTTAFYMASGAGAICAGVIFAVLAYFTAGKVYSSDKLKYGAIAAVLRDNVRDILREAALITGAGDAG